MGLWAHRSPRTRDRQRGAALVEFALVMPLLFLLIFGAIDFGYMINRDTMINNAAREGAREGTLNPNIAAIEAVVRSEVANLNQAGITVTVTCRKPDNTACTAGPTGFAAGAAPGGVVIVKVDYQYRWLSFIPGSIGMGSSKTLTKTVEMRIE